jgi:hypothetical protein
LGENRSVRKSNTAEEDRGCGEEEDVNVESEEEEEGRRGGGRRREWEIELS